MTPAQSRELDCALEFLDALRTDGTADAAVIRRFDVLYGQKVRGSLAKWVQLLAKRGTAPNAKQQDSLYEKARSAVLAQLKHEDDQSPRRRQRDVWRKKLTQVRQQVMQTLERQIEMAADVILRRCLALQSGITP